MLELEYREVVLAYWLEFKPIFRIQWSAS